MVLHLLHPAVVQHAGDQVIDEEAEHSADADGDEDGLAQTASTVIDVVAKEVSQVRVRSALLIDLHLDVVSVDAPDNEDDYHGNEPKDDTSHVDVVKPLAIVSIVLVEHSEDEGDHKDKLAKS